MENTGNMSRGNMLSGAEAMVRMLQAYDVKHIFGLCGDTTLPFYDALARLDHDIVHYLTRDERHAAYMADGYARVTGKPGICEGPSGGGATYILPGLVEANESSIPVLAITTDVATTSRGKYPLTELDQVALFKPVTKWNASLDDAAGLPASVRKAFRTMTTGRPGAVHLAFPFDTQKITLDEHQVWAEKRHTHFPAERLLDSKDKFEDAAAILREAENALIICGGGPVISGAYEELYKLAELLEIPIATTVSGQGAVAEDAPLALGVVGSNGGVPSTRQIVDESDVILFIGCRAGSVTTERWRSPKPGVKIIHIDSDPDVIGANYKTDVGIVSDAKLALAELSKCLEGAENRNNGLLRAASAWEAKVRDFTALATSSDTPIKPEAVIAALMNALPEDAVICADPGTPCPYFSAHYRWPVAGRHFITNRAHGALGYSLAAAIGAQVGRPNATVLSVMGDGSFNFSCGELETIVRYQLPVKMFVFSNKTFGWIKAGQNSGFDKRFYNVDFGQTDHAAVASAFGVKSWRANKPSELRSVIAEVLSHDGPALVDIISQPLHEANAPVSEWVA